MRGTFFAGTRPGELKPGTAIAFAAAGAATSSEASRARREVARSSDIWTEETAPWERRLSGADAGENAAVAESERPRISERNMA